MKEHKAVVSELLPLHFHSYVFGDEVGLMLVGRTSCQEKPNKEWRTMRTSWSQLCICPLFYQTPKFFSE